jgi:hypothetical protein
MIAVLRRNSNMNTSSTSFRALGLAALFTAAISAPAQQGGLDPATQGSVDNAIATIRRADAQRKSVFLTRGTSSADRFMALEQFRATRRKATLGAAEALLSVRGSFPKDAWKTLVSHLSEGGSMPRLVDQAKTVLPGVVADETRRATAVKALEDLAGAIKKDESERESGRKKFFSLLEKQSSTSDDFISSLEKFNDAQAKLDDRIVQGMGALEQALTPAEWDDLIRRISRPPVG